jgi:hypothetical protein
MRVIAMTAKLRTLAMTEFEDTRLAVTFSSPANPRMNANEKMAEDEFSRNHQTVSCFSFRRVPPDSSGK